MLSFKTEPKQLFQECVVIGPKIIIMVFTNLAQLDVYPDNRKGNARPVFSRHKYCHGAILEQNS